MPLTSAITDYDENWPRLFDVEADRLRPIFENTNVAIHHVGSTAVAGLAAKPEIDILVIVSDVDHLKHWQAKLLDLGYKRGSDLMEGHYFFKRDVGSVRTHKLHVCVSGHTQIFRMLQIRDHRRTNNADRKAYEELKFRLEQKNQTGIAEYLEAKAPFLDEFYQRANQT